jgi:hypothetical protein
MPDDLPDSAVLRKVAVRLPNGDMETIWAEELGAGRYRLMNVPFMAFGLSFADIVSATEGRDGIVMQAVVERSGHSSYRVALQVETPPEDPEAVFAGLREIGCGVERFTGRTFGIDVPPATDIDGAYRLLEEGMANGIWWFDEVHVGHPL